MSKLRSIVLIAVASASAITFGGLRTESAQALSCPAPGYDVFVDWFSGSDSNSGTSCTSPFQTITRALQYIDDNNATGIDVLVGVEDYSGQVVCTDAHSGTANARNTFTSQYVHGATILSTADGVLKMSCDYTTWDGFAISGSQDTSGVQVWLEGNASGSGHDAHHNILRRLDVYGGVCAGVFFEQADDRTESQSSRDNKLEQSKVHDNGTSACTEQAHGVYVQGYRNEISNNQIYDNGYGFGVHNFRNSDGVRILYNTIAHNSTLRPDNCCGGILFDDTDGREVNNGITVGNIIYGNDDDGISFSSSDLYGTCTTISYNLAWANGGDEYDTTNVPACFSRPPGTECDNHPWNGSGTNRCADPLFTNYASRIFTLQGTSPAINTGESTYDPAYDYAGFARPSGATSDKGAYEYDLGGS